MLSSTLLTPASASRHTSSSGVAGLGDCARTLSVGFDARYICQSASRLTCPRIRGSPDVHNLSALQLLGVLPCRLVFLPTRAYKSLGTFRLESESIITHHHVLNSHSSSRRPVWYVTNFFFFARSVVIGDHISVFTHQTLKETAWSKS